MNVAATATGWDEVVRAHLSFAGRVYSREQLMRLADECGLTLLADGSNSATGYDDVARYLAAVRKVLGETAFVSAKLTAMNKARILGLRPPGVRWFT